MSTQWLQSTLALCFLLSTPAGNQVNQVSHSNSRFTFDLYKQVAKEAGAGNAVFSPLSVITTLSMVYLGAQYNTAAEMTRVLHYQNFSHIHVSNKQLLTTLHDPTNNYTLDIANGVFASNRYQINAKYITNIKRYYEADFQYVDFAGDTENSTDVINNWIGEQTRDKIMGYYYEGATDRHSVLVLINVVYFRGWWAFDFDPDRTHSGQFRISHDEMQPMDFMFQERRAYYWKDRLLACRILEVPYAGGEVNMYVILPNDVEGIYELETKLNHSSLQKVMSRENRISGLLKIYMPKFELDIATNLRGILFHMGIKDLFLDRADLGLIGPNLMVTDLTHKTMLEVTEEGTVGTAVTGIRISLSGPNPDTEFRMDHPFIFFIKEKVTDNILFMGRLLRSPVPGEEVGAYDPDLLTSAGSGIHPGLLAACICMINLSLSIVYVMLVINLLV